MAKTTNFHKKERLVESTKNNLIILVKDEPVLRLRSTLVSVQDTPTSKSNLSSTPRKLPDWMVGSQKASLLTRVESKNGDTIDKLHDPVEPIDEQIDPKNRFSKKECIVCKRMVSIVGMTSHRKTDICKKSKDSNTPFEPNKPPEVLEAYSNYNKSKRARAIETLGLPELQRQEREKKRLQRALKKELAEPSLSESDTVQSEEETIAKVTPGKASLVTVEQYSQKSFVVRGDTFAHKDKLLEFGGKFNKYLTDKTTNTKFCGWIFSLHKRVAIDEFLVELKH